MRQTILLVAVVTLTACAGEQSMHAVASSSAVILNQYRTNLRSFAESQNGLNANNAIRLRQLNALRDARVAETGSQARAWRVASDEPALAAYSALTDRDAAAIVADLNRVREEPAAVGNLRLDPAPVESVIKQLVELQRPINAIDRAHDLLNFGTALRDAYRAEVTQAASDTNTAATATPAATATTAARAAIPPQ